MSYTIAKGRGRLFGGRVSIYKIRGGGGHKLCDNVHYDNKTIVYKQ